MLSPTSLSGLSSAQVWAPSSRAVSAQRGSPTPVSPITPLQPRGQGQDTGQSPSRTLPRGSLLDLSV